MPERKNRDWCSFIFPRMMCCILKGHRVKVYMSTHDIALCAWPGKNRDRLTSYFTVYLEVDVENYKTVIISKQKLIHPQQGIKMLRHFRTSNLNLFTVWKCMLNNICHLNDISNKYGIKVTTIAVLNTKSLHKTTKREKRICIIFCNKYLSQKPF